ncbi:MAG: zinc-dependent alcohol dehydrogenase [Clostridia bacterium]
MKAVVWTGINTVEIQEVPIPKPGQQQVLIQVKGAGLCSTDLHIMAGHLELAKPPHILGHEIAGIIVETGAGVDPALVGQRVVADTIVSCGTCEFCRRGQYEFCLHGERWDIPYNGGYAEYVVVPAVGIHRLPEEISFEEGAIIESIICPAGSCSSMALSWARQCLSREAVLLVWRICRWRKPVGPAK